MFEERPHHIRSSCRKEGLDNIPPTCMCQLRYAHQRWGTPLSESGRKWMEKHPTPAASWSVASSSAADDASAWGAAYAAHGAAYGAHAAPAMYPPPTGGDVFPDAWGGPNRGIVVPPSVRHTFGVTTPIGAMPVSFGSQSSLSRPSSIDSNPSFMAGALFNHINTMQRSFNANLDGLRAQLDVAMASDESSSSRRPT